MAKTVQRSETIEKKEEKRDKQRDNYITHRTNQQLNKKDQRIEKNTSDIKATLFYIYICKSAAASTVCPRSSDPFQ